MKPHIVLRASTLPGIELVSVTEADLETLRRLKNSHRQRFFHQDEITPQAQMVWYEGYLQRPNDWMFILREGGSGRGCVGYRLLDDELDIYNIIRDEQGGPGSNCFTQGLNLLCAYLHGGWDLPVSGRVLVDNPVVQWACSRGFSPTGVHEHAGLRYVHLVHLPAAGPQHAVSVQVHGPVAPSPC